jgi:DNA repair protein RadC
MKSIRYPMGKTSRIIVSMLCDNTWEKTVDSPETLETYWHSVIASQPDHEPEKENLCVVLVNTRNRALSWSRVGVGTVNECIAHPREILRPVIAGGAYGFALFHNHPGGDPYPSRADVNLTQKIMDAANIMQIRMLDHIIIGKAEQGRSGYYSFKEAGII